MPVLLRRGCNRSRECDDNVTLQPNARLQSGAWQKAGDVSSSRTTCAGVSAKQKSTTTAARCERSNSGLLPYIEAEGDTAINCKLQLKSLTNTPSGVVVSQPFHGIPTRATQITMTSPKQAPEKTAPTKLPKVRTCCPKA